MKFKDFFKNLVVNIKDGVSRFLVAFICSVLGFLTVSYEIIFETDKDEIFVPLCMAYGLAAVLSVLLKTGQEYLFGKLKNVIQYVLCFVAAVAGFVLIKQNYESLYTIMAYSGILISMICFIFFIIMRGENKNTAFPKFVTSYIFSGALGLVVSGGISTCIAAFQLLIFSGSNYYKVYLIANLFVWVIGFINLFLALMPKKDVGVVKSKIFRIFILYVVLPLYILLIGILLVYLAKIVITQNMPVGEINWFASYASLFFIFILLSVMQYTEKLARVFVKFGGYFLIPILIMQGIAVFERINAYGLTTPRTVSLVLIIISILFIAGATIVPKHLNKIALASGIIVLLVTITPFNVIDMPIKSQTNILKTTLEANGMLKDGAVIPNESIPEEVAKKIISSYNYLKYNAEHTPEFIQDNNKSFEEIFGFEDSYGYDRDYIYCRFETADSVDISDYKHMEKALYSYDEQAIKTTFNDLAIELKPIAEQLYAQYGTEKEIPEIYVLDENTGLYFESFDFEATDEELKDFYFNGYVLFK